MLHDCITKFLNSPLEQKCHVVQLMPLGDIMSLSFMSVYSVLQPVILHCSLAGVYCTAF